MVNKKSTDKKIQPLRLYLLKRKIKKFEDALRSDVRAGRYPLKSSPGISGAFFLRPAVRNVPDWARFVRTGVKGSLPPIESTSNAGVLFLNIDKRIVAIVFGTGRYLLKDSAYESDFGLRSTLNAVDPKTLDQIDVNWFGEMVVQKRVQVSQKTNLSAFEIDVSRERFTSLTGKAKDKELGGRIRGARGGFGVHARIDFKDLANQCRQCIKAYQKKDYQKAFPRYDDFKAISDPATIDKLNDKLVAKISKGQLTGVSLSPPAMIDFDDFSGFSYSPKGEVHSELLIGDYSKSGRRDFSKLTLANLKAHQVFLRHSDTPEPLVKWSAYRCLTCEIKTGSTYHVLWDGKWYEIAKTFADKVRKEIEAIPEAKTSLPAKTSKRLEADFLKECVTNQSDLALMDKKNVWCDNAGSEMEVCDLFSTNRQFIHVKRRAHGASGLSHLFAQGRNSAEAFLRDESFRSGAKSELQPMGAKFANKITKTQPTTSKYEVVYVVMGKKRGKFIKELTFFSQLTLKLAAESLRVMGFKVAYQFVEAPE